MTRKPNVPCAVCGKLCWNSRTGKNPGYVPPEKHVCLDCRRDRRLKEEAARKLRGRKPYPLRERKCRHCETRRLVKAAVFSCDDCKRRIDNERYRDKCRRRRARKKGNGWAPYRMKDIAERDGFICGICFVEVVMGRFRHPHPGSPSIDHIVPIANGGSDSPDNVQLAHLRCNIVKGTNPRVDRRQREQLSDFHAPTEEATDEVADPGRGTA